MGGGGGYEFLFPLFVSANQAYIVLLILVNKELFHSCVANKRYSALLHWQTNCIQCVRKNCRPHQKRQNSFQPHLHITKQFFPQQCHNYFKTFSLCQLTIWYYKPLDNQMPTFIYNIQRAHSQSLYNCKSKLISCHLHL